MNLKILGTGCPKCLKLEEMVKSIVNKLGLDAEVSHVYDINKILDYGVVMTPALVIDGKVRVSGKLPSESEMIDILKENI
jgi:small redox-active disulfide protein 2